MIKHIVMWKIKDVAEGHTAAQNAARLKEKLEGMVENIPLIRRLEVGINVIEGEYNWDVVLYTEFDSIEDLIAYDGHPDHEIVKGFVATVRKTSAKVDYEV